MGRIILTTVLTRYFMQIVLAATALCVNYAAAENLAVTQVSVSPQVLTSPDASANIRFRINKPSVVRVKVFDAMNALVWRSEPFNFSVGEHSIDWSGRDAQGRIVVPEAYSYVVEAQEASLQSDNHKQNNTPIIYDMTDMTGGENLQLQNIRYDSKTHKLTFTAPKTGRYILRAGIARAFAIDTLINNNVVIEGEHEISWDGYDVSHVFNSADHPGLQFSGVGYELNSNTIIVSPRSINLSEYYREPPFVSDLPSGDLQKSEFRESKKAMRANTSPNYFRAVNQSRDVALLVSLPESIARNKANAYIIQKPVSIRIDLLPEDIMVMEAQRGEIVLFLDGQLIHDNEVSYYPYTFNWNPQIYDDREHLLTVFVAGFAGNIGMSTFKVQLKSL